MKMDVVSPKGQNEIIILVHLDYSLNDITYRASVVDLDHILFKSTNSSSRGKTMSVCFSILLSQLHTSHFSSSRTYTTPISNAIF